MIFMKQMGHWPNLFIVGSPRAGTTSLYKYLDNMSEIYMSPIKEPGYFISEKFPKNHPVKPIKNKKEYLKLFDQVKHEKVIGEASTLYLSDPESPKLIHTTIPDAKIIISLRDPVERAFSSYLALKQVGWINSSTFNEEIKKVLSSSMDPSKPYTRLKVGCYSKKINNYLEQFGKKQIKILIFEEFVKDTENVFGDVLKFLNIKNSLKNFDGKVHNKSFRGNESKSSSDISKKSNNLKMSLRKIIKKISNKTKTQEKMVFQEMTEEDREILREYYKDDVKKLQNILGRKLPWPNFSHV